MDGQGVLFPRPPGTRPPRPSGKAGEGERPRYTRFTPRTRILCDDCITVIHQLGVVRAPLPAGVRWRRTAPGSPPMHLCHAHKEARTEEEST